MSSKATIELPPKLIPVFNGTARYRGAYGGRGSAKTRSFALMTAVRAYMFAEAGQAGVILCGREFMNSLEDSSMEEVKQAIRSVPWLDAYFDIGEKYIRTRNKRVSYVFAGLRHNVDSIKSKACILIAWVDEAENVSEVAWQKLAPTVRESGSEIWITWNPEKDGSPTDKRYRKTPPTGAKIVGLNYADNPWFPPELEQERLDDRDRLDDQTYAWIWDGAYRENSEAQILSGKYRVEEFDFADAFNGPYFGIDWGFSQDPTAGVRCGVFENRLYIEHEAGKVGLENDDIAKFMIDRLPGVEQHVVRADSARPETISHVKSNGNGTRLCLPRIVGVEKWKGSVEDGIAHLRSYKEIIIHPRCTKTLNEARTYSYKVDRLTGDVLTDIVDKNNHYIDACIEHDQLVATGRGLVPIQDVVAGDLVETRKGLREVLVSRMTHTDAPIYEMKTEGGRVLRATADHRVYVEGKGFLRMDAIRYNDRVISLEIAPWQMSNQSNMAGSCGIDTRTQNIGQIASISKGRQRLASPFTCIAKCGRTISALFRKAGTFITKMKTAKTMPQETWSASQQRPIGMSTLFGVVGVRSSLRTLNVSGRLPRLGTLRQRAERNTEKLGRLHMQGLRARRSNAAIAGEPSKQSTSGILISTAQMHAEQRLDVPLVSMMKSGGANNAAARLSSTSTERPVFAPDRVLSVRATSDTNKVYDLMVEDAEEFFASGVLVHNCRYALGPLIKRRNQGGMRRIGGLA